MSYQVVMTKERVAAAVKAITDSGIEFDGFVGTGTSGALVAPVLAYEFGKQIIIVRKADDKSAHSSYSLVGDIGNVAYNSTKLIFADDFISGGDTLRKVYNKLKHNAPYAMLVAAYEANSNRLTELNQVAFDGPRGYALKLY